MKKNTLNLKNLIIILALFCSALSIFAQETLTFDALTGVNEYPFTENGIVWNITGGGIALNGGQGGTANSAELSDGNGELLFDTPIDITSFYLRAENEDNTQQLTVTFKDENGNAIIEWVPAELNVTFTEIDALIINLVGTPANPGATTINSVRSIDFSRQSSNNTFIDTMVYTNNTLTTDVFSLNESLQITTANNTILINASNGFDTAGGELIVYDLTGRTLLKTKLDGGSLETIPFTSANQLVIAKIIKDGMVKTQKLILKQ